MLTQADLMVSCSLCVCVIQSNDVDDDDDDVILQYRIVEQRTLQRTPHERTRLSGFFIFNKISIPSSERHPGPPYEFIHHNAITVNPSSVLPRSDLQQALAGTALTPSASER